MTAKQFETLKAYADIEPFGEQRLDLRFALLASVIAGSAGAKGMDGRPYQAENFLRALRGEAVAPQMRPRKTVEELEAQIKMELDLTNKAFAEGRRR